MPRGPRVKSSTGIYHIILRGANGQEIFHEDEDCIKFLETIEKYKSKTELSFYAWCLMSNHVHLLLKEGNENISIVMKRIGVSFVSYYNWKYRTTGHLFQDRFKSENVETDRYLLTVIRYIHQNPVKARMVKNPVQWKWSSCLAYYGNHSFQSNLTDCDFILKMFSTNQTVAKERFKEFNERINNDECLEERETKRRLSDKEASQEIKKLLGSMEIAQVKSLPKIKREEVLRRVKKIDRISQRQAARILGISPNLLFKA